MLHVNFEGRKLFETITIVYIFMVNLINLEIIPRSGWKMKILYQEPLDQIVSKIIFQP